MLLLVKEYLHFSFSQWMVSHWPQSQYCDDAGEEKKWTIPSFLWIFSFSLSLPIKGEWHLGVALVSLPTATFLSLSSRQESMVIMGPSPS